MLGLCVWCAFGLAVQAGEAAAAESAGETFDLHTAHTACRFRDPDMDFVFESLVLGSTVNGGCEIGEAFSVASRVADGDAVGWADEWTRMASRVLARGEEAFAKGRTVSARSQFFRAANYVRFSLMGMTPDDPRFKTQAEQARRLVGRAGELFDPPLTPLAIPFEAGTLPGWFRKAVPDDAPRKTLLVIGGGETFAEDLVYFIMPQAFERGWNFATLDLPGQGLTPFEGLVFRPDSHRAVRAALDQILARRDVDPAKTAVYGLSGGGAIAPRAAQDDPRIQAVVMNACVVDAHALFAAMTPLKEATPDKLAQASSFRRATLRTIAWRWGTPMDEPRALIEANRGFGFDPARLTAPGLILVGEGEYASGEVRRQQALCYEGLRHPAKKLVVAPRDEGAANHCVLENRSLAAQTVFDWLDEVFDGGGVGANPGRESSSVSKTE